MAVAISKVEPGSYADAAGFRAGDILISLNGHIITDVLDYRFYLQDSQLKIRYKRNEKERNALIQKDEMDDIGLVFSTYLMDRQRACCNRCLFCFIDQLPGGLRDSLYFKDDDQRLSFLFGNYVTLTNMTDRDIQRITEMHISPVNISVHTTNPALRVQMMGNKRAGEVLSYLPILAKAGIKMNCQLVLCPGYNDGKELEKTLLDLGRLYPAVESIAAVPVGITKYRAGLTALTPFTKESALETIKIVENFAAGCLKKYGTRLAHCADELYLKAELSLPQPEKYEDFPQLENGVGMVPLLRDEFCNAVEESDEVASGRPKSIATGVAAAPFMRELVDLSRKKWHNINCSVYPVANDFFGHQINVAGLLTGGDIARQMQGKPLGEELLIPAAALRREGDLFLDDMSLRELEQFLSVKITPVSNDGSALLNCLLA